MKGNPNYKERADRVFARYIRQRDCPGGHGRCISCGAPITPQNCQCGHFIPRQHTATRFDERNCNAQCEDCNEYEAGNIEGYTVGLVKKYGDGIVGELNARKNTTAQLRRSDYIELLEKYK